MSRNVILDRSDYMKVLYRVFRKKLLRTAHHEAGHYLVTLLFRRRLLNTGMTMNRRELSAIDTSLAGAVIGQWIDVPEPDDYEAADIMCLVAVGGMCAQTLASRGFRYVDQKWSRLHLTQGSLDVRGASGDYPMLQTYARPLATVYRTRQVVVEWSAFRWVFRYLMHETVWQCANQLAWGIVQSRNRRLEPSDVEELLRPFGGYDALDQAASSLLSQRYPLRKASFTLK